MYPWQPGYNLGGDPRGTPRVILKRFLNIPKEPVNLPRCSPNPGGSVLRIAVARCGAGAAFSVLAAGFDHFFRGG